MIRILTTGWFLIFAVGLAHAEPYKALRSGGYMDMESGAVIPSDPRNRHYRAVQEWIAEGNTPVADVPSNAELADAIEREADRRIVQITGGDVRQKQMLARSNELLLKRLSGEDWTAAEQDEVTAMAAINAWAKSVRQAEADAIASLPDLTDSERLAFDVETDVAWPANP